METTIIVIGTLILIAIVAAVMASKARYHETGSSADVRNMDDYGVPARSLYTSTKILTLHHHIEITDENEQMVYESNSKVISIHDKTDVTRADGTPVAHIEAKIFTLREVHYVTMADGTKFELSNEILHIIKDVTNIVGLGWRLEGNILQLNFVLMDETGKIIAAIGQKIFSFHDKYSIDIYQPQYEEEVVAIVVTLQHMIKNRQVASSSGSGSSSN